ncbi:MAG: hypothetical protein JWO09_2536 [Bacteroidetes bacterium]|nr:hypothetical protein [Bacteroidota bacterium]
MAKKILSTALGLIGGLFIIISLEVLGHVIYPMPAGMNLNDPEAINAYTSAAPSIVFILLVLSYALGSLVGGLIASAMAPVNKMANAITVGGILMGLGAYNLFMIPHPVWTIIISIFLFIPCSYLGGYWGIKASSRKAG